MTAYETKVAEAVIRVLHQYSHIEAIGIDLWDKSLEIEKIPRLSINVAQGTELVYMQGVYRSPCRVTLTSKVKDDTGDDILFLIQDRLLHRNNVNLDLTDAHYHCFAVEAAAGGGDSTAGKTRMRTIAVDIVGFDKDRFNLLRDEDHVPLADEGQLLLDEIT